MAIDTPPIYSNIIYNSLFFPDANSTGFTEIQANTLYLRKTVQDIDPFLATFQSGIKTNTVNTTDATGATNCGLFQGATNSIIDLGPTTQPVGHSALIRLGLANSTIQCGSGTGTLVAQKLTGFSATTNSLYNDLPNPINLGLTSSAIAIGTSQVATNTIGIGSASSVVSISNSASRTAAINIGSGSGSSGSINIGNGVSSNNTVSIANGVIGLGDEAPYVNILSGATNDSFSGGNMNLFTTSRGTLTVGGTNNTAITFNKAPSFSTGLLTDTINPTTTSGTIQIGHVATNTNVEVAAQASRSVVLHLGDGDTSSGGIHIGNGVNSSNNIQILNANYTGTAVKGTVNIQTGASISALSTGGGFNLQTGTWNGVASIGNPSSRLDIICPTNILTDASAVSSCSILTGTVGAGVAGGSVSILSGNHNATSTGSNFDLQTNNCKGICTIGNPESTIKLKAKKIEIANNGLPTSASGGVDIAAGSNAVGSYAQMGSTTLTTLYLRSTDTKINDNVSGDVTIGWSNVAATGSVYINRPVTVGYGPTADSLAGLSFLGGIFSNTSSFVYTIGTTKTAFVPLNNLPAGRYLFQAYVFISSTVMQTNVTCQLIYSSSSISNNQTSGFTVIFSGNESYTMNSATNNVSINPFFQYDVVSPNNNIALACNSGIVLLGPSVFILKAIRIG